MEYYRDKIDDVNDNASYGKSFKYKTKIVGKTPERRWISNIATRTTTTTTSTNFKRWSHYSTQISEWFLEISWFTTDKLWNRTSLKT